MTVIVGAVQYTADQLYGLRRGQRAGRRHRLPRLPTQQLQRTFFKPSVTNFLSFGLLNICSVSEKVDGLLDVQCDHRIDVQCLTETRHDTDCVAFSRLRLAGYNIVDRPRPRTSAASLNRTNHGGVAMIAKPGINVSAVSTVSDVPATYEYVCALVTTGQFKAIVTVIYRPGSDAVEQRFFDELSSLLDVLASFQEPVFIVGDFIVRFERAADPVQ